MPEFNLFGKKFFLEALVMIFFFSGSFVALLSTPKALAGSPYLPYSVVIVDPQNDLGADRTAVLANLDAAIDDWGQFIYGKGPLAIKIVVTKDTPTGRFSGRSATKIFRNDQGQLHVYEGSGTYKLRTGLSVHPNQPDVVIQLEPDFMRQHYWIDRDPKTRTSFVPKGKVDLVTVFAHELGHAFGMNGYLNRKTGELPPDLKISVFDSFLIKSAKSIAPRFDGPVGEKLYGDSIPVTWFVGTSEVRLFHAGIYYSASESETQNLYHYGRQVPGLPESNQTFFGLMAGAWINPDFNSGLRIRVGALDAAILQDVGVPVLQSTR